MANKSNNTSKRVDRKFRNSMDNVSDIMNDLSSSLYGVTQNDEITDLQQKFNEIMHSEIDGINRGDREDITSFLNKLYSSDRDAKDFNKAVDREFLNMGMRDNQSSFASLLSENYQNRLMKLSDIRQVSRQLVELKEAIGTMRDAVVSADINTGRINREFHFGNSESDNNKEYYTGIIEDIEEKFGLQKKIKDFIVFHTLEEGEYFSYTIPYADIFTRFMENKDKYQSSRIYNFHESVDEKIEAFNESSLANDDDISMYCESCAKNAYSGIDNVMEKTKFEKTYVDDLLNTLGNITVINDPIPLPVMEEGIQAIKEFQESFVSESGDQLVTEAKSKKNDASAFADYMSKRNMADEGIINTNTKKHKKGDFTDVKDCYIKMISGLELLPIDMMDETIGYLYIRSDDATPVTSLAAQALHRKRFTEGQPERTFVNDIAGRIVSKFDKKFLKDNPKFKKLITEAIEYVDINERRIQFQFIPKEYIFPFKVNCDEEDRGQSMLEDSLFYAKLYLLLLLYKMVMIIKNSSDQKVNYIRSSGIDKNLINNVQEIARQKQARSINMTDLFSLSSILNKIGNGSELYLPVGRNNERPMETEILSGQDVQLNTELMEMLKNSYILGTGVPSAIMNYMNEADFAKSLEVANSKMNGRVINYQLDLNPCITDWYRGILRWCTNIPNEVIDEFSVSLTAPKGAVNTVNQDMLNNFTAVQDFLISLYYGQDQETEKADEIKGFKKRLAKIYLPNINFDMIDQIFKENQENAIGESIKPKEEIDIDGELNI